MSAVADDFFSLFFFKSDLIFFMFHHYMYLKEPKKNFDIYAHVYALLRDIELLPCTPLTLQEPG